MKARCYLGLALAALLLYAVPSFGQFPGGGGPGGPGGRGGFGGDPNQFFDRLANGKDVIVRAELTDPRMQAMFDRMAQRLGITNGQITRQQFQESWSQRRQGPPGGAPGGQGPAGANPAQPGGGGEDRTTAWAETMFRQLDTNGDGVLNNDEMPEALRAEKDKWDTDHNGLIDLNEFKAYFQARMQQFQAQRAAQQQDPGGGFPPFGADPAPAPAPAPAEPEERRPVVYRAGKLPKELPAWFAQLDTDGDGQIGLYEWKASGRPIEEFLAMDRNNDGFLTIEEVLHYQAQSKGARAAAGSGSNPNSPGGGFMANRGNGGNGSGRSFGRARP